MARKFSAASTQALPLFFSILWPLTSGIIERASNHRTTNSMSEISMSATSRHFVLVHGACHGAWCWYKLVTLLQDAGHKVTALDLAASGINPKKVSDLRTIKDYHEPLYSYLKALSPQDHKVILVGHSMGGYAVSCAMERFPDKIALAVFVAAFMLGTDLTIYKLAEHFNPGIEYYEDSKITTDGNPFDPSMTILFGANYSRKHMYQRSPRQDLALALLLIREAKFFNDDESRRQLLVTKEKFGSIPRAYFIAGDDQSLPVDVQRWMVQNNPPDVVRLVDDGDHMVMLSKPKQLYYYLLEVVQVMKNRSPS